MGIAARDTICTNYTYSADCVYYLLAWQDTDCVGMRNIASSSPAETSQDEANSRTGALQKTPHFSMKLFKMALFLAQTNLNY